MITTPVNKPVSLTSVKQKSPLKTQNSRELNNMDMQGNNNGLNLEPQSYSYTLSNNEVTERDQASKNSNMLGIKFGGIQYMDHVGSQSNVHEHRYPQFTPDEGDISLRRQDFTNYIKIFNSNN